MLVEQSVYIRIADIIKIIVTENFSGGNAKDNTA